VVLAVLAEGSAALQSAAARNSQNSKDGLTRGKLAECINIDST
jgi:hypothetical protein